MGTVRGNGEGGAGKYRGEKNWLVGEGVVELSTWDIYSEKKTQ